MVDYQIIERKPTAEEMLELRQSVGWRSRDIESYQKGLENSLYGVCVYVDGKIIGVARVVGDVITCFYIQDVIVKPEYQKKGIGYEIMKHVMKYIERNACHNAVVGLMAAKNVERFYEKFGFWKRPNEHFGHGMTQFWKKTDEE